MSPRQAWKYRWVPSLRKAFIVFLVFVWTFSGWPPLVDNPRFPPAPDEALAAEATIDASVSTAATSHVHFGSQTVFISDQVGYHFYRDSSGECVYSKTTNGGANWGAAVIVDDQGTGTDCINIAVWYDKWTPGDTGSTIHIVTMDTGSDSLFYNAVDTANNDALLTNSTAIDTDPGAAQGATNAAGANYPSITKGTDGVLYVAEVDASDQFVLMCSTTCGTGTNWTEDNGGSPAELAAEPQLLVPLPNGDVMFIEDDASADDILSKVYTGGNWDANFATVDAGAPENGTYDQNMAAAVDPKTGDVYLAYLADVNTLGRNDDIRTAVYSGGTWNAGTADVLTDDIRGLTSVAIAFDANTADVYVAYAATSTNGTAAQQNVYWKKSTDGMASWGSESSAVNSGVDNTYGVDLNAENSERIFVSYQHLNGTSADSILGDTIVDLTPPTYAQAAYRFYANQDSADVGSALSAQDTTSTLTSAGQAFRLRLLVTLGGDGARKSLDTFKLEFAEQVGTCDTSFTGESYSSVTDASVIAYKNNASVTDGTTLTDNANDPDVGHTVINQTYEELNNFSNSSSKVLGGQDALWDFALYDNGATANTTYCFRVVKSDGTQLTSYGVVPRVTTYSSAVVSVSLSQANFDYGYVTNNTASNTLLLFGGAGIIATNDGTVTENMDIYGANSSGGGTGWTLAGNNTGNNYVHAFCNDTDNDCSAPPTNYSALTTSPATLKTGIASSGSVTFQLRITTPTAPTDVSQQSAVVTVQATQQ